MKPTKPVDVIIPAEATAAVVAYYRNVATPSQLTGSPVARHMERSGRTDTPARSCVCGAPATHIVSLANEPKVPTGILPNLCLNCACYKAVEKKALRRQADANRASGLKTALAKCAGCKRGVLDPFTGKGQKWHRACWFKSDEWRSMPQSEPEDADPFVGLIGVGR